MLHFYYLVPPMKARPFILRCTAILFILVISQKSGAGLFLHNLLHTGNTAKELPVKQDDKNKELSYSCTCIDDFLMPFAGTEAPVFSSLFSIQITRNTFFEDHIPFYSATHLSLRGPPTCKP